MIIHSKCGLTKIYKNVSEAIKRVEKGGNKYYKIFDNQNVILTQRESLNVNELLDFLTQNFEVSEKKETETEKTTINLDYWRCRK